MPNISSMMRVGKRIANEVKVFCMRNRIILCFPALNTERNRVNLHYWHAECSKGSFNFADSGLRNLGDTLSPVIVEYLLKKANIPYKKATRKTRHLFALGSILLMGYQDATIWGSGILTNPSCIRTIFHRALLRKLDIRCVRGPLTRNELRKIGHSCPPIYGDPGVLMLLVYSPNFEKKIDYLVIPHYSMERKVKGMIPYENLVSMATDDYKEVINRICSARKVISGSLHGIILAEAYGVPAIFLQDQADVYNFKYIDWSASTQRPLGPTTTDLFEAIEMKPSGVPDLREMQQALIDSFPYDLWK